MYIMMFLLLHNAFSPLLFLLFHSFRHKDRKPEEVCKNNFRLFETAKTTVTVRLGKDGKKGVEME